MRTLKCVKLDFLKSKSICKFLVFFMALCTVICVVEKDVPPAWGSLYMVFGGLIVVATPFFVMSNISEIFTSMLPATIGNRVYGRYLFGTAVMAVSAVLGLLAGLFQIAVTGAGTPGGICILAAISLGIGLIIMDLEFLVLYFVEIKNAQILSIIRMVPGFALFFGGNALVNALMEEKEVEGLLRWLTGHMTQITFATLAVGVAVTVVCAVVSCIHEKMKY